MKLKPSLAKAVFAGWLQSASASNRQVEVNGRPARMARTNGTLVANTKVAGLKQKRIQFLLWLIAPTTAKPIPIVISLIFVSEAKDVCWASLTDFSKKQGPVIRAVDLLFLADTMSNTSQNATALTQQSLLLPPIMKIMSIQLKLTKTMMANGWPITD